MIECSITNSMYRFILQMYPNESWKLFFSVHISGPCRYQENWPLHQGDNYIHPLESKSSCAFFVRVSSRIRQRRGTAQYSVLLLLVMMSSMNKPLGSREGEPWSSPVLAWKLLAIGRYGMDANGLIKCGMMRPNLVGTSQLGRLSGLLLRRVNSLLCHRFPTHTTL